MSISDLVPTPACAKQTAEVGSCSCTSGRRAGSRIRARRYPTLHGIPCEQAPVVLELRYIDVAGSAGSASRTEHPMVSAAVEQMERMHRTRA